jgi:ATP-binding protein involved in chromosome partitioning
VTRTIRTYSDVSDGDSDLAAQVHAQSARLHARLGAVRAVVVVASGKGGVGKSFVSAQLATALATRGLRVGALDADVNGPSLAAMLGADRAPLRVDEDGVHPAPARAGCVVMSSDLLLATPDAPVRWREPVMGAFVWQSTLETGVLREFLSDVAWGTLDTLVIDLPPGTDKIARVLALVPHIDAMLIVTTPSRAAGAVVARSLTQVREAGLAHVGVVANMERYACPACGVHSPLFRSAADAPAGDVWATIPFDPSAAEASDRGLPLPHDCAVTPALDALVERVLHALEPEPSASP